MPVSLAEWVGVIAAILAIVIAVVAIAAFLIAQGRGRREEARRWEARRHSSLQRQAGRMRRDLEATVVSAQDLARILVGGRPLINAASEMTKFLYLRLGPQPTPEKFRKLMTEVNGLAVSAAVGGWCASSQTEALERARTGLVEVSLPLQGQLRLVSWAVPVFDVIIEEAYSPKYFVELLQSEKFIEIFCDKYGDESDISHTMNALTVILQRNATRNFQTRFKDTANCLLGFIRTASNEFMLWDNTKLVKASETESRRALDTHTGTEGIKVLLKELREEFSSRMTYEELLKLTDRIEVSIPEGNALESRNGDYTRAWGDEVITTADRNLS